MKVLLNLWPAIMEAEIHLPRHKDFLEEVSELVRDVNWAWRAIKRAEAGQRVRPAPAIHGGATYRIIEAYLLALESAGSTLRSWDGLAPLMLTPTRPLDHAPVHSGFKSAAFTAWRSRISADYTAQISVGMTSGKSP